MLFFKKKKKGGEVEGSDESQSVSQNEDQQEEIPEVPIAAPQKNVDTGDMSLARLTADVEKLKAQFTTFYELQKTTSERFSRINEQIGELRSMMIERD